MSGPVGYVSEREFRRALVAGFAIAAVLAWLIVVSVLGLLEAVEWLARQYA